MGEAFGWVADIISWFGQFIPRLYLMKKTYGGVKYVYGSKVVEMKPGLHFWWPLTTEIEEFPTARQTQELSSQVLMTKDYETVTVRGVIIYDIYDVVNALSKNYDVNDTIADIAKTSIVHSVTSRNLTELLSGITNGVSDEITEACKDALYDYGVRIHKATLIDCSTCTVINNLGSQGTIILSSEEDEE